MKIPSYENEGFVLLNGEAQHKETPEIFWIPSRKSRENLKVGDIVKLMFSMQEIDDKNEISVERMWVVIDNLVKGAYEGILDNDPVGNVKVECGQRVPFLPEHVIQIYKSKPWWKFW